MAEQAMLQQRWTIFQRRKKEDPRLCDRKNSNLSIGCGRLFPVKTDMINVYRMLQATFSQPASHFVTINVQKVSTSINYAESRT